MLTRPQGSKTREMVADIGHDVTIHAFDREQKYTHTEDLDGYRIIRHQIAFIHMGQTKDNFGAKKF